MEPSAWKQVDLDRIVNQVNSGCTIDEVLDLMLATMVCEPRIERLSEPAKRQYCVLALTSMLASHWKDRLDIELATAQADATLSWQLIAGATGHPTARAAMMSFQRLKRSPARRNRTPARRLAPAPDTHHEAGTGHVHQNEIN